MVKLYRAITRSASKSLAKLRVDAPDVMKSFATLGDAATRDGVLSHKTK